LHSGEAGEVIGVVIQRQAVEVIIGKGIAELLCSRTE
jgi:hypothetical protein